MIKKFKHIRKLWNGYIKTLERNQERGIQITEPTYIGFKTWLTYNGSTKDIESSSCYYDIITDCWMNVSIKCIAEKLKTMIYFKEI